MNNHERIHLLEAADPQLIRVRALLASAGPADNERPIVRIAIYPRYYDRAAEIAASSPSTISGNCRRVKLVIKLLL